jgi:hypothetical protein
MVKRRTGEALGLSVSKSALQNPNEVESLATYGVTPRPQNLLFYRFLTQRGIGAGALPEGLAGLIPLSVHSERHNR